MTTSFMQPVPSPGFNQGGLEMGPRLDPRQVNQPAEVTRPFLPALAKAAEKTNPMNAVSQAAPVSERTDDFINKYKGGIA